MAPQKPYSLSKRRLFRVAGLALALPVAVVALFLGAAWIGSSIPRNAGWVEPDVGVEIMVIDNGVHTEIVVPIVTHMKDWRETFPATDLASPHRPYTHVAVSWGEKEVFLNTPRWRDLTVSTALNAAFAGDGLMHVSHYVRPAPGPAVRPLRLTNPQYARLISRIEKQTSSGGKAYPGYAGYDVFYDAPGAYHLGNTCNQWTADTLAFAGVKIGLWTPFSGGVMKWIPEAETR